MTTIDLDELDRLHAEAEHGDWDLVKVSSSATPETVTCFIESEQYHSVDFNLECNAAYIVALHNAYPALSARVRALESERECYFVRHDEERPVRTENRLLRAQLADLNQELKQTQLAMHEAGYKSAAAMLNPIVRKP